MAQTVQQHDRPGPGRIERPGRQLGGTRELPVVDGCAPVHGLLAERDRGRPRRGRLVPVWRPVEVCRPGRSPSAPPDVRQLPAGGPHRWRLLRALVRLAVDGDHVPGPPRAASAPPDSGTQPDRRRRRRPATHIARGRPGSPACSRDRARRRTSARRQDPRSAPGPARRASRGDSGARSYPRGEPYRSLVRPTRAVRHGPIAEGRRPRVPRDGRRH